MASELNNTPAENMPSRPPPKKVKDSLWVALPLFLFSLMLATAMAPRPDPVAALFFVFYLGWLYGAIRLILEAAGKNLVQRFRVGLALLALAPFLSILVLILMDDIVGLQ
jgi:hypothetical protein